MRISKVFNLGLLSIHFFCLVRGDSKLSACEGSGTTSAMDRQLGTETRAKILKFIEDSGPGNSACPLPSMPHLQDGNYQAMILLRPEEQGCQKDVRNA